jgi:hypothetical protein
MKGLSIKLIFFWVILFCKGVDIMHMADALISPLVGGTMMATTAGVAAYSIKKIQND